MFQFVLEKGHSDTFISRIRSYMMRSSRNVDNKHFDGSKTS